MQDNPAAALGEWFASWRARAVAAGKVREHALCYITLWHDGTGYLLVAGGTKVGGCDTPIAELIPRAEAWLAEDEAAIINATLGLAPDGSWAWPGDNDSYLDAYLCQEVPRARVSAEGA